MKPVLKWVGGKSQLLPDITAKLPVQFHNYFEPFAGGGALMFSLKPQNAHLNDFNKELINLYQVIKDEPHALITKLKKFKNTKEDYYRIREEDRNPNFSRKSKIYRAARTIYLNKTCYNGLYRVNSKGEFNTPFGDYKKPLICDEQNILEVSAFLQNVSITNLDFYDAVKDASIGDFVYFDPPYDPLSITSAFTSYNAHGFNKNDQIRLKELCDLLDNKGVKWMLSNSATPFIIDLYKDYHIDIVKAKRSVNSKGDKRGKVDEVLVRNYEWN